MWRSCSLLLAMALLIEVSTQDDNYLYQYEPYIVEREIIDIPYTSSVSKEEYVRHVHSMFDMYRGDAGAGDERTVVETNALVDTKYRTWKRNADIINSLLALPKGMNEAGR